MDSQQPQQSEALYDLLAWFELNKRRLLVGFGVVVAVVGLFSLYSLYRDNRENEASRALSRIRVPFSPNEPAPAELATSLAKLAQDYSGTAAAERALLLLGGVHFTQGRYAEAQTAFERFIREHSSSALVPQAAYGIAVSLDAQGKPEALQRYDDFIKRYPNDANADQARLHLATSYEANGRFADALKLYEAMTKGASAQGGGSSAIQEAQQRQFMLMSKHPELMPSNPPPARATSPVSITTTGAPTIVRSNLAPTTNRLQLQPIPSTGAAPRITTAPAAPAASTVRPATNAPAPAK